MRSIMLVEPNRLNELCVDHGVDPNKTNRRWRQFTVRSLLVLIFVCAVASALFLRPSPADVSGKVNYADGSPIGPGKILFESGKQL